MAERSYAQLRWQQDRFGLLLINSRREKFFLYADKLCELYAHQDEYLVLKLRDRKPGRAIGYYPGQVVGTLDESETSIEIHLYVSEPYRDVGFKKEGGTEEPETFHVDFIFTFPLKEFLRFKRVIDTMLEQEREFTEQLRAAEMTPLTPLTISDRS